jgi:hypothetical protein
LVVATHQRTNGISTTPKRSSARVGSWVAHSFDARIGERPRDNAKADYSARVQRAVRFSDEHLSETLLLADVARGASVRVFHRIFSGLVGEPMWGLRHAATVGIRRIMLA